MDAYPRIQDSENNADMDIGQPSIGITASVEHREPPRLQEEQEEERVRSNETNEQPVHFTRILNREDKADMA